VYCFILADQKHDQADSLMMTSQSDDYKKQICPCCSYRTLADRGRFEICSVCFWQDDGQDDIDADKVNGGPNSSLSLTEARQNYREFGACERRLLKYVRPPTAKERS
jgi:hypothetical protein